MIRRKHDANFKAKIALEAVKENMTIAEISNKYSIGPTQIKEWKSELMMYLKNDDSLLHQKLLPLLAMLDWHLI